MKREPHEKLYREPLLKASDVPFVQETNEVISEALRRVALIQQDLELLLHLSEHMPDDLELLENAQ